MAGSEYYDDDKVEQCWGCKKTLRNFPNFTYVYDMHNGNPVTYGFGWCNDCFIPLKDRWTAARIRYERGRL